MLNNLSNLTSIGSYGINDQLLVWLIISATIMFIGPSLIVLATLLVNELSQRHITSQNAPMSISKPLSKEREPAEDFDEKRAA